MCSRIESDLLLSEEEDNSQHEIAGNSATKEQSICKKCKVNRSDLTLRTRDNYCAACFLSNSKHKFRATLGKHKIMRSDEKVLVSFKANDSSIAMIDMIYTSLKENSIKKLLYIPCLIVIDDCGKDHRLQFKRKAYVENIVDKAKNFGFQIYVTSIESPDYIQTVEESNKDFEYSVPCDDLVKTTWKSINGIRDDTSRKNYIDNLRIEILMKTAEILKCQKIFLSDSGTSLAIKLIAGLACGRGTNLSDDTGFSDNRFCTTSGIILYRPMREFSDEEIKFYNQHSRHSTTTTINGAKSDFKLYNEEISDNSRSIQNLTQSFLVGLQDNFSGTISTIFRTGDKLNVLNSNDNKEVNIDKCILCNGKIDAKGPTLEATKFSRLISSERKEKIENSKIIEIENIQLLDLKAQESLHERANKISSIDAKSCATTVNIESICNGSSCLNKLTECCTSKNNIQSKPVKELLMHHICYSCIAIADSMESIPKNVMSRLSHKMNQQEMEAEIKDYLL